MSEFTRKELKKIFEAAEIEVPKDVLGQICDLHTSSNEDLTESVKTLKNDLEKAEQERDEFKAKAPKDGEETVLKADYDKLQADFDDYKNDIKAKETRAAKETAVKELYKSIGISEKRLDSVLKVTNIDEIELDKDGKIKDADSKKEAAKTEWADFIEKTSTRGTPTANPPTNNGGSKMTKSDIYKKDEKGRYVLSTSERQKALAENPELLN